MKKKYKIVGLFSTFSQIRWNDVRPFNKLSVENQHTPAKANPAELTIDELFSRFTASTVRKNIRFTR